MKWLFLSLLIVLLDQASKFLASNSLELHVAVPMLPGLNMTLMHNTGAAFSFLSQAGGWQRWFFILLAAGVSIFITIWLAKLHPRQRWLACSLALILGGAIGNLLDRIMFGYVVDFIDVYYRDMHWPAFNIADSAITVGAILLIIDTIWLNRQDKIG
ncbi:MAG TPA: signal peptidase II [Gammaproteobacteria bacterium]|nr:signal peptidase II [Gammaproteobacteria bacterium]